MEKETININFVHAIFEEEKKKVKEKWLSGLFSSGIDDLITSENNIEERYFKWGVSKRAKWSKKSKKVPNRRKTIRGFCIKRKAVKKFYEDVKRYKKKKWLFSKIRLRNSVPNAVKEAINNKRWGKFWKEKIHLENTQERIINFCSKIKLKEQFWKEKVYLIQEEITNLADEK
jgi:hypothetical protein